MQHLHHPPVKRQVTDLTSVPSASGLSGGQTASSGIYLGTSLLLGPSGTSVPSVSLPPAPGESPITSNSTSTQASATSTSTSSLSTGAVLGIIVAVFLVVLVTMFAIYAHFRRRTASLARQRYTRRPPPAVRGIEGARGYGQEKQANSSGHREGTGKSPSGAVEAANLTRAGAKTPDSDKFGLFEKEPSVQTSSDEKATTSENHSFDPSTMPDFAKYQSDPAAGLITLPPPSRPFVARGEASPVISWDGETVNGDPFLSLHASTSEPMSPSAVTARQTTPRTTDSAQHRWESAEVVMMDETPTERPSVYSDAEHNPFGDDSVPSKSPTGNDSESRSGTNPFFNAAQHSPFSERSTRSRKSSVSTVKRTRSRAGSFASTAGTVRPGPSEGALLSLLAALDSTPVVPDDETNRTSIQTTASLYAPTETGLPPATPKAF